MAKLKFDNKLRYSKQTPARKKWIRDITKLVNRDWEPDNTADPKDVYKRKGKEYYGQWAKKTGKHFIH